MDAITDGWSYGRGSRSLQFVKFELMLDRPLAAVRAEYGMRPSRAPVATPDINTPELLRAAA
jgi:ubiquinone biosynthesis protein Coq4